MKLKIFVVWEPILPGDWRRPTTRTLARIPDPRAAQFWDPDHLVAQELRRAIEQSSGSRQPSCCFSRGIYWDMAAIFPLQARSNGSLPPPVFFDGAVVRQVPEIRAKLRDLLSAQTP